MRKVIFLDIDGVLNPKWWERKKPADRFGCAFVPKTISCLAKIVKETKAEIVISSSWKDMGLTEYVERLESARQDCRYNS